MKQSNFEIKTSLSMAEKKKAQYNPLSRFSMKIDTEQETLLKGSQETIESIYCRDKVVEDHLFEDESTVKHEIIAVSYTHLTLPTILRV